MAPTGDGRHDHALAARWHTPSASTARKTTDSKPGADVAPEDETLHQEDGRQRLVVIILSTPREWHVGSLRPRRVKRLAGGLTRERGERLRQQVGAVDLGVAVGANNEQACGAQRLARSCCSSSDDRSAQ
jgi:hypothetical protein